MLTTSQEFFEQKYRESADPWNFARDAYELSRYDAIMDALGGLRYKSAYEPGCSVGILTERLASICDSVDACDISPSATKRAQERCAYKSNVHVWQGSASEHLPAGADLLLFCEIGYYFEAEVLRRLVASMTQALGPSATVLGCHWLGSSADHILSGDRVHEIFHSVPSLIHEYGERHPGFRIDRWRKVEETV